MSLRARLALVLAGTLIGPLLAVGLVVGVLVPRAAGRAADADLGRAVATASTVLGERCLGLADVAAAAAGRLQAAGAVKRVDVDDVTSILAPLAAARPGVTLVLVTGEKRVTGSGPLATTWDPAPAAGASCGRRASVAGRPELVESVDLPVVTGLPLSRIVAVRSLDPGELTRLRDAAGLPGVEFALLDERGAVATTTLTTSSPAGAVPALVAASRGTGAGEAGGWRVRQRSGAAGVPYTVAALTRPDGAAVRRVLLVVVLLATAALVAALAVISSRLTRPLAELTAVARRFGGGDLGARTGICGTDEVGSLAAAFDTMADDLQARVEQLRTSQEALSDTFARFGDALGATHDLDGLLRTVVAAAMLGSDATTGVAYLGDAKRLDQRLTSPEDAAEHALAGLADLADDAVRRARLVVTDLVDAAGPALATPLRRDERVIGALAVARDAGSAPFDQVALDAVTALATHAGTAVANVRAHEETSKQSITDPLTGAGNLRHLTSTLAKEVERATRFNRPLSLLMCDLDHFKQVNDTAGHAFGDAVLREFARRLGGCLREVDVVARYGGEEFVVVLPETGSEGACAVATRIVEAVRKEPFKAGGKSRTVTVSVGVSAFPDHGRNASELTRAADAALYAAKHGGRDRWVLAGGSGGKGVSVAQTG